MIGVYNPSSTVTISSASIKFVSECVSSTRIPIWHPTAVVRMPTRCLFGNHRLLNGHPADVWVLGVAAPSDHHTVYITITFGCPARYSSWKMDVPLIHMMKKMRTTMCGQGLRSLLFSDFNRGVCQSVLL